MQTRLKTYSRFVKIDHTLFSFPMLVSGALLAHGELTWRVLLLILVAGTGALFAATVRAPLTGIVLAAELTGNFGLILPIAIACITSTLVAHALGGRPIYSVLLERALDSQPQPSA